MPLPRQSAHFGQNAGTFGEVFGVIAAAFKVGGDFHHRQHRAQIARCGGAQRDQARGLFVDLDVKRVDDFVSFAHALGQIHVPLFEGDRRIFDIGLDQAPIFMIRGLNSLKITIKGGGNVFSVIHGILLSLIRSGR